MATILLSAAGAAAGQALGVSALGLSGAVLGRAAGATLGRAIDQSLMGSGAQAVETGRVDRFRLTNAGEGQPVPRLYGRLRLGGQVIWASQFEEIKDVSRRGGKGAGPSVTTTQYSYRVSLAIALCEAPIAGVLRLWADGQEIAPQSLAMRVYTGEDDQLPDPKMEAVEGTGKVPAYRGTAYVVIEDLDLSPFGNRVPQFSFEVLSPDRVYHDTPDAEPASAIQAVAMIPGTGEYALATEPAVFDDGLGRSRTANVNSPFDSPDLLVSLQQRRVELPNCAATSLIVSWFGTDLRCDRCQILPRVEQNVQDASLPWSVAGLDRSAAGAVPQLDARPVYGGTPSDQSVIQALTALASDGQEVMYYPFVLMEQAPGNTLTDPYSGDLGQPAFPWRGRITASLAPEHLSGQAQPPDQTAQAAIEVAQFFGTTTAGDFQIQEGSVTYSGPQEWGYRRFILHNAALCVAAGGVSAFCIGSEMRGLTQLRGAQNAFPAVAQLIDLAADVRQILGPDVKIGYAADWSEYFGYHPQDSSGDVFFHLDPLWADENIDFIGIDNYMPLSDWREGKDHLDASWGSLYDLDYLRSNVEGGEGYEWYYHSEEARAAQIRTPITDEAEAEPWVFRYKDLTNWWARSHHNRVAGVRSTTPTAWVPQSKPIWFTEIGCAAIDKGTNQPNKFLDPKSDESGLPYFSNGVRDDYMQMQYLRALIGYWADPAHNPVSDLYDGPMLDLSRMFVWAWDSRPFPAFPRSQSLWSDGENYGRGHWLNGRGSARSLASVITEICQKAGATEVDTKDCHGVVSGYGAEDSFEPRSELQSLLLRFGVDALERDGKLVFRNRHGDPQRQISQACTAVTSELPQGGVHQIAAQSEIAGRLRLRFPESGADFEVISEESILPGDQVQTVHSTEFPIAMSRREARQVLERWLSETQIAQNRLQLALPPSELGIGVGDVMTFRDQRGAENLYRVERIEYGREQLLELVRVDASSYAVADLDEGETPQKRFEAPAYVHALYLDLPLITGEEVPHAPHIAVNAAPWPGEVALYSSAMDDAFELLAQYSARATMGVTQTAITKFPAGRWDRHSQLQIQLAFGGLETQSEQSVLAGRNLALIGDGSPEAWELVQFQQADLVGPDTYILRNLLRGQQGSGASAPEVWPEGSYFVLLDQAVSQLPLPASSRNLARNLRIGPAGRPVNDPSFTQQQLAFSGIGLRPYAPVHLRAAPTTEGVEITWIRQTRLGGDDWTAPDVPLGEEQEQYLLRLHRGAEILQEEWLSTPHWVLPNAVVQQHGGQAGLFVSVAQVSGLFGPGPAAEIGL